MTQHDPRVSLSQMRDQLPSETKNPCVTAISGEIWGYDPGGKEHGVSRLTITQDLITACLVKTVDTAYAALNWFGKSPPLAFGVDTLTAWSTGRSGDRPADRWLRQTYPQAESSVMSPNELRGAMCVNGMAVVWHFRNLWPNLLVSETHPKILYYAIAHQLYRDTPLAQRTAALTQWLGLSGNLAIGNDHEWDAAASAYAAWKGLRMNCATDLHQTPPLPGENLIHPAGPTVYFWP
jgi:hypothetical protein